MLRKMPHTAKLLNRTYGRAKARHAWGALGGAKAQPTGCFGRASPAPLWAGAAESERSRKSIAALAGKAGPVTGCANEE